MSNYFWLLIPTYFTMYIFSGGWGYAPKFRKLKQQLEDKFADKVEVTGEGTPDTTGNQSRVGIL